MNVPLSVPQTVAVLRTRYPEALACIECARLIATERRRYASLTDEQVAVYVCGECRSDRTRAAHAFVRLRGRKDNESPRGPLVVVIAAAPQPHDAESLELIQAAHALEMGKTDRPTPAQQASKDRMAGLPWWVGSDDGLLRGSGAPERVHIATSGKVARDPLSDASNIEGLPDGVSMTSAL